jgi:hypothetical protein
VRQVEHDERGHILRQARHVELGQHVTDDRVDRLVRRRILGVGEVQRHLHAYLAIFVDAQEVDVQDLVPERVHLHVAKQNALHRAVEFHGEDRRMKDFVLQGMDERVVVDLDRLRLRGATIDDAWRAAASAQPSACAAPFGAARKRREFVLHAGTPICLRPSGAGPERPAGRPRWRHPGLLVTPGKRESLEL